MIKSLTDLRTAFTAYLEQERFQKQPSELYEPNNYLLNIGGKRLRPVLALLGCELMGKDLKAALPAALAVEYFHNYTLIHDDIMDNASMRRGHDTVHEKFGTNEAILAGDVLMIYAYKYLAKYSAPLSNSLIDIMNTTAIEVCEGQSLDMSFEDRMDVAEGEYLQMIRLKTSVLLAAAFKMGALVGGADEAEADQLYAYGENLGLAFQMQDDLLDTYGGEQVGKQIGGDIIQNKKTLLLIHAIQQEKSAGTDQLHNLIQRQQLEADEKIKKVKGLYGQYGSKEYVIEKRNGYVNAALEALKNIDRPHEPLKELIDALVLRSY